MTKDTGPARLPALPPVNAQDPALRNWMRAVAERLEVREGSRGNPYERAVTVREMVGLGLAGLGGTGGMVAASAMGGASAQQQAGYYGDMSADAFAEAIRNSKLYQGLIKRLDDATRFDDLPEQVRAILLVDIADEARKRQADIRTLQYKLQTATNSLAYQLTEVTAAVEGSAAGVREMTFASATRDAATAGKVTQVQARLDGVPIPPERILPTVYASLGALAAAVPKPAQARYYQVADAGGGENLLYRWNGAAWVLSGKGTTASATATLEETAIATADRIKGLSAEKTIKVQAGNKVAGIGLSATEDPEGNGDSAFIVMADRFAIVGTGEEFPDPNNPPPDRIPFGVDTAANVVYINGQVRIGNSGKTIVDLVDDVEAIAGDGPINFIGSFLIPPATFSLRKGSVYRNNSDGNNYILNADGGAWVLFLEKGIAGEDGNDGGQGPAGPPGIAALTGYLTNETHTVNANAAGVVAPAEIATATGEFKVFSGVDDITALCTFSLGLCVGMTATLTGAGVYTATGVTGAEDSATATMTASFGGATLTKVFTLTRARTTELNDRLDVSADSQIFKQSTTGVWDAASLTLTATLTGTLVGRTVTWAVPAGNYLGAGGTGLTKTVNRASMGGPSVTFTASVTAASGTVHTDQITVSMLADGAKGATGAPGADGAPGSPGAPGAPGSNGAASVTATTTRASAAAVTNADLNGAIVAALGRDGAMGDAVTLANPTAKWSDSWIRRTSVWERVTLYIDGNVLITGTLFASTLSTQKVIIRPIGTYSRTSLAISGGEVQVTLTTDSVVATPLWSYALAPPTGALVTVAWFGNTSTTCTFIVRAFSVATGAAYTGTIPTLKIWMF